MHGYHEILIGITEQRFVSRHKRTKQNKDIMWNSYVRLTPMFLLKNKKFESSNLQVS